jgi:hypothetical protein
LKKYKEENNEERTQKREGILIWFAQIIWRNSSWLLHLSSDLNGNYSSSKDISVIIEVYIKSYKYFKICFKLVYRTPSHSLSNTVFGEKKKQNAMSLSYENHRIFIVMRIWEIRFQQYFEPMINKLNIPTVIRISTMWLWYDS